MPVDRASRRDGELYAAWLDGSGRVPHARLCTDREWEHAMRGADGRLVPKGNALLGPSDACSLALFGGDETRAVPCAVATHPLARSPFGVEDAVGNVAQWTSPSIDSSLPGPGVLRGGSYRTDGILLTVPYRETDSEGRHGADGIRICADPP
jgi:formylglycine-generating enzyme required for sulfatase activity